MPPAAGSGNRTRRRRPDRTTASWPAAWPGTRRRSHRWAWRGPGQALPATRGAAPARRYRPRQIAAASRPGLRHAAVRRGRQHGGTASVRRV